MNTMFGRLSAPLTIEVSAPPAANNAPIANRENNALVINEFLADRIERTIAVDAVYFPGLAACNRPRRSKTADEDRGSLLTCFASLATIRSPRPHRPISPAFMSRPLSV